MVMWSALKHFAVRDAAGRHERLDDLSLDLSTADYPTARGLIIHHATRPTRELAWSAVHSIDWRHSSMQVAALDAAAETSDDDLDRTVLIDRDVLDALILDLPKRQSTRANDLWLVQDGDALRLRAADIGAWALLRRVGHGMLGHGGHRELVDWRDVEFLRGDPHAALSGRDYHRRVASLQPSEIANLLSSVPYLHAAELVTLLPDPLAADTLELMQADRQVQVFDELDEERKARLLQLMAPDAAVDLLARHGPESASALLERLPSPRRDAALRTIAPASFAESIPRIFS